ncbi:nicotinate phosphoribosyltransferase [Oceanicola granulosus HTCC2516]|uniref:Nicotinate phosphoribosyltransferase n=1 Tax=Oceanicola granulosus (strain ATCC BAA-861 / DSM 15982 / KCTC 12143 / HTCC2516) TaxID=314256 RepID=Q2CK46_OCEGH|nr:hypothetical protein [Oceanicola granulosus]EAR52943.1 nicotinate phosphoribosyltransferase [Oceanicola granulosus HTCC2516]
MATPPEKSPKRPRLFVLIPLGFVLLILAMFVLGEWRQETTDSGLNDEVEEAIE